MKIHKHISVSSILFLGILLSFSSCEDTGIIEHDWQLVWSDEFNSGIRPDETYWNYDVGATAWANNELQNYRNSTQNAVIIDSALQITALRDGNTFTSARINTKGKFEQTYGRFEARIKLPYGPGIWPAFWLLGGDIDENPWPQCGEIDVMEFRGQQPNIIHGSVHGPGYSGGAAITGSFGFPNDRFDKEYHVFAIEWGPDYIYYFVDDEIYQTITPDDVTGEWVYDHDFFILLNMAVGGDYVGFPTDDTPFPQTMYVDYVRVYVDRMAN